MMDDPLTPGGDADQGPPPSLICPITQELPGHPVTAELLNTSPSLTVLDRRCAAVNVFGLCSGMSYYFYFLWFTQSPAVRAAACPSDRSWRCSRRQNMSCAGGWACDQSAERPKWHYYPTLLLAHT